MAKSKATRMPTRVSRYKEVRFQLKQVVEELRARTEEVFSRHVEEDPFQNLYAQEQLLLPPYSFDRLYTIYEESDILQSCVEAMQLNIAGFGYELVFLGDDVEERETPEAKLQRMRMENFFDYANDEQSWMTIRKLAREDREVLGNSALEIVRSRKGEIQMVFQLPFKKLRIASLEGRAVSAERTILRDGKEVAVKVRRYFRRFAQILSSGRTVRWFKTFGDPRTLDATDGKFKPAAQCKIIASEILHFKQPFGGLTYGLPRWIGPVLDVMGRRNAQYVNYDLFNSQGIPPIAITVSGGSLTDESVEEVEAMIRSMRGVENWNRIMLLESNVESVGLEDKGSAKIELKNLAEYRKEDQMFERYLGQTEKTCRHRFRLPPLFVGGAESFTHATARAAQTVAEEQVFIPERKDDDEVINSRIVRPELKVSLWKYKSKGPQVVGAEEISDGIEVFSKAGALTVNHAVDLANRAFGTDMSKFKEPWANYPIVLVLKMIESGAQLKNVPFTSAPALPAPATPKQPMIPGLPAKVFKSDMFSQEERSLYKRLLYLQDAIDRGLTQGEITDEELEQEAI